MSDNDVWVVFDLIGVLAAPSWRDLAPFKLDLWHGYKVDPDLAEASFWEERLQRTYRKLLGFRPEMLVYVHQLKKRGVKVAIASNFRREWLDALLAKGGGAHPFDAIFLSTEIHAPKPQATFFQALLKEVPRGAVFVDDTEDNCLAAEKAGFVAVWAHPACDVSLAVERHLSRA